MTSHVKHFSDVLLHGNEVTALSDSGTSTSQLHVELQHGVLAAQ